MRSTMTDASKPRRHGHRDRRRAKLPERGAGARAGCEILEVLLMAFIPRQDRQPVRHSRRAGR